MKAKSKMVLWCFLFALRLFFFLIFLFLAWTALLWKSAVLGIWFLGISVLFFLMGSKSSKIKKTYFAITIVLLIMTVIFSTLLWQVPFDDLMDRMKELHGKAFNPGPKSYTLSDRLAVWSGNMAMGMVGFGIGFREVAWETMRMGFPGPKEHVIQSSFAMKSQLVKDQLSGFARQLEKDDSNKAMPPKTISWTQKSELLNYNELRVGLALSSPFYLSAKAVKEQDRWRIDCRGSAAITYPRLEKMTPFFVVDKKEFAISEAMFWALQELEWMHPFTVIYEWSVYSRNGHLIKS